VESNWEITTNRYVAYFDIMGFKDMVLRSSHNEIYEMMKGIDEKIKLNANVNWDDKPADLIKTTTYSDSIIIYSKDDSYDSENSIICTVSALTSDLLSSAIPHKGAIAFGTMTVDMVNSIFFGQPLIDAYLLQEELYFYGIVVHATAEQEIEKKTKHAFVHNYLCNFKNGNSMHLTIFPLYAGPRTPNDEEDYDALYSSCDKLRFKTSGHLRKYIDNTESYLNLLKEEYGSVEANHNVGK